MLEGPLSKTGALGDVASRLGKRREAVADVQ